MHEHREERGGEVRDKAQRPEYPTEIERLVVLTRKEFEQMITHDPPL
jgi:hypothetical protein